MRCQVISQQAQITYSAGFSLVHVPLLGMASFREQLAFGTSNGVFRTNHFCHRPSSLMRQDCTVS